MAKINPVTYAQAFVKMQGPIKAFAIAERCVKNGDPKFLADLPQANDKTNEEMREYVNWVHATHKKNFIFWTNVQNYIRNKYIKTDTGGKS